MKGLLAILPAMPFAVSIELIHGGLVLVIVQPFSATLEAVLAEIPTMIIANLLGVAISVIVIQNTKEIFTAVIPE